MSDVQVMAFCVITLVICLTSTVQVVPMKQFTLDELSRHDGSDPSLPMLLSIRGVVYDITTGKNFYGPDGEWYQNEAYCHLACNLLCQQFVL